MKINIKRGAKFGAASAGGFAVTLIANKLLRGEAVLLTEVIVGTIFALLLFGLIGALTGKVGSDFGDA